VDAAACSSFDAALGSAAAGGDTIDVKCGTYGAQLLTNSKTGNTTIQAESPLCVTVRATTPATTISFGAVDYVTIKNMVINSSIVGAYTGISDTGGLSNLSTHVTLDGNQINVGTQLGGTGSILLHAAQDWRIVNNTFGPSCCGELAPGSPVPITVGKPSNATPADCTTEACNLTITGNVFQYGLDDASYWPSNGWGPSPGATCTNSTLCHLDSIHIWGVQTATISNNRFYGTQCQDIFIETTNASLNKDINIIGNTASAIANTCNGFISLNGLGAGNSNWGGTINVGFNESPSQLNMTFQDGAFQPGTVFNVYGNYVATLRQFKDSVGAVHGTDCSFTTGGGPPSNVTLRYQYNVWRTGPACAASDATGTSTAWVNAAAAPAVGLDMHKTGPAGIADNFVPCASLTIGSCPSSDFDGDGYAAVADAGADQR
jgi:hypothetical protein